MKRTVLVVLALLVVLSIGIFSTHTSVFASSGGKGNGKTVSETVVIDLHPTPWTKDQIAAFQQQFLLAKNSKNPGGLRHNEPVRAVSAATACAAQPNETNCTGQDPIDHGCVPSARQITAKTINVTYLSQQFLAGYDLLEYSDDCQSNWAKGVSGYGYDCNGCVISLLLGNVKVVRDDGVSEQYSPVAADNNEGYTDMVFAPVRKAKACVDIYYGVVNSDGTGGGGNTGDICTAFY